ncbi:MAG: DUF4339 domain-containing protein [Calothrix sp. SM1_5_4]|nr:DUF4339 domain-containing protein [Calothrix sp. SM1_5_4]
MVSHQGQEAGPFTLDEIVAKVRGKELDLFDYIFDESKQDWIMLMEHEAVSAKLKSAKPTRPPQPGKPTANGKVGATGATGAISGSGGTSGAGGTKPSGKPQVLESLEEPVISTKVTAHSANEWFVLKGDNRFGPFNYTDLVRMLQQKVVYPFDFVWHSGMETWKRVAEIPDFENDKIRTLMSNAGNDVFIQRRFKRKKFQGRVLVHDNTKLWKGYGFEISKGGVGITMHNALVVPGQQLTVHFTGHEDWPAFNAVCEVVSKTFVNDDTPVEYGLRFLSLSQEVQEEFYKKVA